MLEIFKCASCGKVVMVAVEGEGQLVCCKKPMTRQVENTTEASTEKHIPVVEKGGEGIIVKVGAIPHPMEAAHFIQWIEVMHGTSLFVKGLKSGDKPEATFPVPSTAVKVRAYCNVHGLWTNKPHHG